MSSLKQATRPKTSDHENEEKKGQTKEDRMDKTLADSYPASDPPSSIPDPSDDPSSPAGKGDGS
jgi:hypothetical protein